MSIQVASLVSRQCGDQSSLTQGHEYLIVEISDSLYRVVDDSNEPTIYHRSYFLNEFIEPPTNWHRQDFEDGEWWSVPSELSEQAFFEKWFDGDSRIKEELTKYCGKHPIQQ